MSHSRHYLAAILAELACMLAPASHADQGAPGSVADTATSPANDDQTAGVAEIVVTATRRSESLQKVPIAVSALSAEVLTNAGANNVGEIQELVPGVVIQRLNTGVNPYIRGVGAVSGGFSTEQPIATYIDGIYMPYAASGMFAFNNIERIEVLKGPQGTLFGRNSAGGLIQVVTRDPSQDTSIEGSLSYANYDTTEATLYATTGLGSDLAVDLGVYHHDQGDGWGTNIITGDEMFKDWETSVTSKLKWTPSQRTTVTLRGLYDRSRTSIGVGFGVFPGSIGTDGTPYLSQFTIANRNDPFGTNEQQNYSLRIEQELDFATLISLSGYNYIDGWVSATLNGIPGSLTTGQGAAEYTSQGIGKTFTQEIQLTSPKGSPVSWIGGMFFMRDHLLFDNYSLPTCIDSECNASPAPVFTQANQLLRSYAPFGEVTVPVMAHTRVTLGLRYTNDRKDVAGSYREPIPGLPTSVATLPPPNAPGDTGGVSPQASFSKLTWRNVVSYDISDTSMVYVSDNRGFKAGAYNLTVFSNPVVKPEVLDAYELGFKNDLFDRRLRLNVAAFYYDYRDLQVRSGAPPAPPGFTLLLNAARSRMDGFDADFEFVPERNLRFRGGVEILDAVFTNFPSGPCTSARVVGGAVLGGASSAICDLSGNRVPRAPRFTSNIGMNYRLPTRIGELEFDASDAYNSGFFWDVDNRLRQDSYHLVTLVAGLTPPGEHFSVQAFARNLTDSRYIVAASEATSGTDVYTPGQPRTYGMKVNFKF